MDRHCLNIHTTGRHTSRVNAADVDRLTDLLDNVVVTNLAQAQKT